MYKLLITILLLIQISCYSQKVTKDSVVVSKKGYVSLMKDIRRCDSLQVAYYNKSVLLNDLIKSNLLMFDDVEKERIKRAKIEEKLKELNDNYLKLKSKNDKIWIYGTGGVLIGAIATLILF